MIRNVKHVKVQKIIAQNVQLANTLTIPIHVRIVPKTAMNATVPPIVRHALMDSCWIEVESASLVVLIYTAKSADSFLLIHRKKNVWNVQMILMFLICIKTILLFVHFVLKHV